MASFRVVIVPHTHWDREWYLPAGRMCQRLAAMLDDAVVRLEADPSLTFHLDGQVSLIDDYLDVEPGMRRRVAALVSDGRLALGPWYVLADEILAGDEPLVRNLLIGRQRAADLGGWLPVGYSPDAFGHPAALPAILRGFGIATAVVWRGCGEAGRGEPAADLFHWEAPDGSSVLTHRLPPAGYEYGVELPTDAARSRARWRQLQKTLGPRAAVPVLLLLNGADHHALQPDLARAVRTLEGLAPHHEFVIGTLATYFDRVSEALRGSEAGLRTVGTVRGELRCPSRDAWVLQGVHATRAALKRRIAEGASLLVRWAEPQAALAAASGGRDRRAQLGTAWRHHLLDLSHDVLAGCVVDDVADDVATRAREVIREARGLLDDALLDRLRQDLERARRQRAAWTPALVLVNPSARPRDGIVEASVTLFLEDVVVGRPGRETTAPAPGPVPDFSLRDPAGRIVPHQVLHAYEAWERLDAPRAYPDQDRVWAVRVALDAPPVPALGLLRLEVGRPTGRRGRGAATPEPGVAAGRTGLVAPWGAVSAARSGFDVQGGARSLNGVPRLVSERDEGDTYTFEPLPGDVPLAAEWGPTRVVWPGPLVAAVGRPFAVPGRVRGRLFVRVDRGSSLIRFALDGENLCGNHRLRMVFPIGAPARATADMPFGAVTRALCAREPTGPQREWPVPTGPMHRFVSGSDWTILTRGLHEYELLPDGAVAVTLFRAVGDLSRGTLRARPGHAAWPAAAPGAQELGPFRVELALAPVAAQGGADGAAWDAVEAAADAFHAPLAGRMLRSGIDVPDRVGGPELIGSGLAFKTLKPRDQGAGVVLRCVNVTEVEQPGVWRWPDPIARAYRARLDETVLEELRLDAARRAVAFTARPAEIVTIVIEP
jgi:mannosylglycerate hydrolase